MAERKIVVIEDDLSYLSIFKDFFEEFPVPFVFITDGLTVEAVKAQIAEIQPDLVITDLHWNSYEWGEGGDLYWYLGSIAQTVVLCSSSRRRIDEMRQQEHAPHQYLYDKGEGLTALRQLVREIMDLR